MNQEAIKQETQLRVVSSAPTFSLVPKDLGQAMELAKIIADSDLAPKDYRGKPGNVLIAVQMGAEVGLSPMAAIQSIAVINGKPSLYGDVGKAILLSNGFVIEEDDTVAIKKNGYARCKISRKGHPPCERTFSIENAKTAGLYGKAGPWSTYPERQMAWRAFWFAARDIASDVLKGLAGAEEVIDYIDITPKREATPAAVKEEKTQLPTVTDEELAKVCADKLNPDTGEIIKMGFKSKVQTGEKTADELIQFLSCKGILSEEQQKTIHTWQPKGEQA